MVGAVPAGRRPGGARRADRGRARAARAQEWPGWLALALFGVFTAFDAIFPLDCAAISDPTCERGALSLSHHLHGLAGALAGACALAATALLAWYWATRTARVLAAACALTTVLTLAAVVAGQFAGLAQRLQATVIALWLIHTAARLLAAPQPERGPWRPHVVEDGSGPAVLIAPGLGGACFHWDAVAAGLAPHCRVIRFDRPGLGRSPAAVTPPTLYGEAARLAGLAPGHPEKVAVIAHSVAAWHAEAFARLHPLRVSRLVLVDPSCREDPDRGCTSTGRAVSEWLPALGHTWGAAALARVAGPAGRRLSGAGADPGGVYRAGKVLTATAGSGSPAVTWSSTCTGSAPSTRSRRCRRSSSPRARPRRATCGWPRSWGRSWSACPRPAVSSTLTTRRPSSGPSTGSGRTREDPAADRGGIADSSCASGRNVTRMVANHRRQPPQWPDKSAYQGEWECRTSWPWGQEIPRVWGSTP
ncbi:alpha/beta fold hydrolase [Nonomuraea sp. NBC_01738]|uniref:alpha/beta fold hydrolase n=1 Tax=Nonomuraea sp. NBC_01738 TaxID=2976003 RepID=UPI002E0E8385|nr:alpha/beta fold hydrolase [Nonomuraea sp. NBC_01738]